MTAPLNTPGNATAKDAASARKRRRRAPAGGAADDCFTCAKRNVKCDRRRPYCSQCLEIGNECSGYKTQLTWGVGVASRGKLRGLSLPIAKAPPVNPGKTVKSPTTRTRTSSTASTAPWIEQDDQMRYGREDLDMSGDRNGSMPTTPYHPYDMSHHMSPTEQHAPAGWTHIPFASSMPTNDGHRYPGMNLQLPHSPHGDMMASSMDSMSEVDYMSPLGHTFKREDVPQYLHSPTVMYDSYPGHGSPGPQSPVSAIMIESSRAPTSCPSLAYGPSEPSSSMQSHLSHVDSLEAQLSRRIQESEVFIPGTPDMDTYSTSAQSHAPFWAPSNTDEESVSHSVPDHNNTHWSSFPSQPPSPSLRVGPDLINKMPFFMDYYEKTMCPGMVFIDSPGNPFREHILQLAATSRSLQHAICALASCNLRMKRRLSLGHGRDIGEKRLDISPIDSMSDQQPEDQSLSEEYQHRNLAVHLLNEQLNDSDKSTHDSGLATILMLCHYRMAESGIAKFHTQFAGVKKILGMRRLSPFPPSRESAWMEAVFTYFDAISASINDREAQLNTHFYGVTPDAQLLPPGAENLVGCDRELFRTISKLGRLNLLSQHRPVQNLLANTAHTRAGGSSRASSPLANSFKASSHMGNEHQLFGGVRFDGNGFGTTLDDDDMMGPTSPLHSPTAYDDHRSTFWREWKDARIALQSWEFDASRVVASLLPASSAPPPTGAQVRDLGSLSEAFRYAALLYTERLASPNVPSAHANFRNLVSQVVYYATSLESGSSAEKFLLWPLFVAGSECVNELQQNIVRSKCRDIMARSGYMNNLAALDVLERLWAGDWKEDANAAANGSKMRSSMLRGGPFNWTKCITGPGVEVEWIMF
ncbi:fungal-specific transcription factor domain-containing protein [Bombardia bombarda]|uniref:Fungal-specific transcription factor domain-containing protein n=1 Tax=Bombardia bombarda TaxID=252184 RepID=A0AA40BWA8_9PEZI|nr:fungal-specific transcription factor domain-containing protein [Bombardia bombarda]